MFVHCHQQLLAQQRTATTQGSEVRHPAHRVGQG